MNLFFQKGVIESIRSVEEELNDYFHVATKFRSRARNGTIIIADESDNFYLFLDDLISKCSLNLCLYHVKDAPTARRVLSELGQENIKVIVINCDLLFLSANGITLAQWIEGNFPNIPIWVSECSPDKTLEIRKKSRRVGIVPKGEPFANFVDVLGFPSRCLGNKNGRKRLSLAS